MPSLPAAAAQAGEKRPAQKQPAATPQPAKRSKGEGAAAKAPATAPPKVTGGGDAAAYLAALKAHLSAKGPAKLAALGSAVKRPEKCPKLKHFLDQHKNVFKYDAGNDTVSLA